MHHSLNRRRRRRRRNAPILLVLLLLLPSRSSCEVHRRRPFSGIAAGGSRADALRAWRGGFGRARADDDDDEDDEEDEEWEYYEDRGDDDDDDDDNDDEEGQASRETDEYEYYEEAGDAQYYGKIQDIDGEFSSDGDAGESDAADGFSSDAPPIHRAENRLGDVVSLPRFFAALAKTNAEARFENPSTDSGAASPETTRGKWWPGSSPPRPTKGRTSRRRTQSRGVILPSSTNASSGASFVSPLVYKLSSVVRDLSTASSVRLRSSQGGTRNNNVLSRAIASFTRVASSILRPILLLIRAIVDSLTSIVAKSISIVVTLVRRSVDALWYGPVEGVTTTGISRAAGLDSLLVSSPLVTIASSMVAIGFIALWIRQHHHHGDTVDDDDQPPRTDGFFVNAFRVWRRRGQVDGISNEIDADEDTYYDNEPDSNESPSVEEELEFMHSFHAANPTSQARIAKTIAGKQLNLWPFHKGQIKSRKGQRQRSIKSIQNWWRQRPSSSASVAIVESPRAQNQQQPPPSQQISRLQTRLAQSEQERAVLQRDVQRLRHRLRRAHRDARAILEKNQRLESQQAKADRILTAALEAERRKANREMVRVRDTMKDVLERERMLMRGRLADTWNGERSRQEEDAKKNNNTYVERDVDGLIVEGASTSTLSAEETARDSNTYEEEDMIWGKRQRSLRRKSSSGKDGDGGGGGGGGGGGTPAILGGKSDFTLSRRSNNFTRV